MFDQSGGWKPKTVLKSLLRPGKPVVQESDNDEVDRQNAVPFAITGWVAGAPNYCQIRTTHTGAMFPVADASVDVVLSNCVINMSSDKQSAFAEILRLLRPGRKIAVADIIDDQLLDGRAKGTAEAGAHCPATAFTIDGYNRFAAAEFVSDVRAVIPMLCLRHRLRADAPKQLCECYRIHEPGGLA
jgi:SAM-dependent methyltransferase